MTFIKTLFTPNYLKYEGVRPINIYLLRVLYFLMFAFVGMDSWTEIITHQGPWNASQGMAFCVWAAYSTLSFFGLINPLKMLPIPIFMIFYKTLWLAVVAYPLWQTGTLAGSKLEGMANIFIFAPVMALFVPWGYVFKHYVLSAHDQPHTPKIGPIY